MKVCCVLCCWHELTVEQTVMVSFQICAVTMIFVIYVTLLVSAVFFGQPWASIPFKPLFTIPSEQRNPSNRFYSIYIAKSVEKCSPVKSIAKAHGRVHFTFIIWYIDGLLHDCSMSSALAMETLQCCSKPSRFWKYSKSDAAWCKIEVSYFNPLILSEACRASTN